MRRMKTWKRLAKNQQLLGNQAKDWEKTLLFPKVYKLSANKVKRNVTSLANLVTHQAPCSVEEFSCVACFVTCK